MDGVSGKSQKGKKEDKGTSMCVVHELPKKYFNVMQDRHDRAPEGWNRNYATKESPRDKVVSANRHEEHYKVCSVFWVTPTLWADTISLLDVTQRYVYVATAVIFCDGVWRETFLIELIRGEL